MSVIPYRLYGDSIDTTSPGSVDSVPVGTTAVITSIVIVNTGTIPAKVYVKLDGGVVIPNMTIPVDQTFTLDTTLVMSGGSDLVIANPNGDAALYISGVLSDE